ncbi:MAG: glutamate synthase large subunit [Chloroflexota bacterium]
MAQRRTLYEPSTEHDACGFGFVVDIAGRASHAIVADALTVLVNLEHRGASGSEANTGDGAGILVTTPHAFLAAVAAERGLPLPADDFGVATVFLPRDEASRMAARTMLEHTLATEGLRLLGWRDVPTNPDGLGDAARSSQPVIAQAFIGRPVDLAPGPDGDLAFDRRLYVARRLVEKAVSRSNLPGRGDFYIPSMSCRTIVYKGMLNASQLLTFYPDLLDPRFESPIGLVHSRFSTNTFPSWSRAHPYRFISHNGEINTLRGNVNWVFARQSTFKSSIFGDDLAKILPAVDVDGSDTTIFDNVLELLHLSGRSLAHSMMMMVPEPWSRDPSMDAQRKAFYEYHSCLMEPWDGPASLAFTDGIRVGAMLDRNGLRPGRYWVTRDGRVVMASETGVLDIPAEDVIAKGRLQPGRMFLVDTAQGRIIPDDELKAGITGAAPYAEWVRNGLVPLEDLPAPENVIGPDHETVLRRQEVFGYTTEDVRLIIDAMATTGADPIGSMGNDAPLAVLSERPQLLYNYFKQLFAQVTNPPVDAIREEIIMATDRGIGPEENLLEPGATAAHQVTIPSPIISNAELARIRALDGGPVSHGFRTITLPILFKVAENGAGLRRAIEDLRRQASEAIAEGYNQVILSDRGHSETDAPIPALLAVSSVHHHLVRAGTRGRTGLLLESGEPREAHHFCLLIGYGASAINPYLAFETIDDQVRLGVIPGSYEQAEYRYRKAATKGVIKAISRMGISTVHSYHGAQVFEAIGLNRDFVDEYFTWTPSRIAGIGIEVVAKEVKARQDRAYPPRRPIVHTQLQPGGQYQYRADGENHLFNPLTVHTLQKAVRTGDYHAFKDYTSLVDDQSTRLSTLRGLLELRPALRPVPIDEVEPVESIVRRFKTGAMSYGSISGEAHEALAIAMNRIGGKSNTGEGGEDPARYVPMENGDSKNSAIKQVASGRFGVTSEYLVNARELQIKMAQGAKPGEGGQLPGSKVYPWIARTRHSTPGVGLISPPPHHDIYSIEDLAQLIYDLKCANHEARISVKLVAEVGVGTVAAGVAKAHADVVLISGHDGGTGASPLTSIKHAGIPWELGLAEAHQVLLMNDLRSRIVVEVDGQLKTGRDVVVGALLGAEEFGFATGPLVALGCVMMRACHLNTCPVGVATQDPELRKRFAGQPEHVINFMRFIAQEVREHMARLGFRTMDEMIGRSDRLEMRPALDHWKARGLDFTRILSLPDVPGSYEGRRTIPQQHGVESSLDATTLLALAQPALTEGLPVRSELPIRNINRTVGTMLGSEVTRRWGREGLPDDTIDLTFTGSAGQSFGAFIPRGVTLRLIGDVNDYVGKGLSGGRIIVRVPMESPFDTHLNVVAGNVALYGATSGELFMEGVAGERFAVRNSGATAVTEGVGDHGCEYMTGGRVLVLGRTGRNFAAGMSGGIAWVHDEDGTFASRVNAEMVSLGPLADHPDEAAQVRRLVERHAELCLSERAEALLAGWDAEMPRFVRVLPNDYRRVLEAQARMRATGLSEEEAEMAAFEENIRDLARAGGS